MVNIYRLIILVLFCGNAFALPTVSTVPPNNCNAANYPALPAYANDPKITHSWICKPSENPGVLGQNCGWNYVSSYYGWTGNYEGQCTLPLPVESCPENSTMHTAADGSKSCSCSQGYEEKDNQCRKINPCPAGQHEEGGACVPDNCKPDEIRVNGH